MKTNFLKSAFAFLLGTALLATSCEDPISQPEVEPAFPESVTKTIAQGESCEIALSANMDWDLVLSGDLRYFTMTYNGEPATTISGKEGEFSVTVKAVEDETDFEQRKVTLTMKMKGAEQVVAEVHRNGSERIFKVYPVKIEDGAFVYGNDDYEFEAEAANDFTVTYNGGMFMTYLRVEANFDWALKDVPEWLEINATNGYVSSGKANEAARISLWGVNSKYPLDGATDDLSFVINEGENPVAVEGEYKISIPEIKDMFLFEPLSGVAEFNAAGEYNNAMAGWVQTPLKGSFTGIQGAKVYLLELGVDGYMYYVASSDTGSETDWVQANLKVDDEANMLASYDFEVKVTPNESKDVRRAVVLLIPGSVEIKNPEWAFITSDETDVKEEYQKYIYAWLMQSGETGGDDVGEMVTADAAALASVGAKFEKTSDDWIYFATEVWGVNTQNCYNLTLTNAETYNVGLVFAKEFWGARMFDIDMDSGNATEVSAWGEPGDNFSFTLDDTYINSNRFLVCYGENDVVIAVIRVIYDPEAVIGDGSLVSIPYPMNTKGISIRKMNSVDDGADMYYNYALSNLAGVDEVYEYVQGKNPVMPVLRFAVECANFVYPMEEEWPALEQYMGNDYFVMMTVEENMTNVKKRSVVVANDANNVPMFALVCTYDPEFGQSAGGNGSITANDEILAQAGAKFGLMKDNGNYADMLPDVKEYFGMDENNCYILTVSKASGTYSGFTFAKPVGGGMLYEYGGNGLDESAGTWAELGEDSITVTLQEDDWNPKFILLFGYDEASDTTNPMAVICVSRE